ncbi:sulfotransferase family 2 domain-containing protein [Paludisphaera rhizosphaerae]|uniref:sulfotransferase family 2 domain-containing protein n=1 Tax=Paludisphaera rhizosphaerae TaxID=2711216 RepID=UPI0013ED97B7|nr:sulfotransferase family 2 domain-containing protein [Paludisphaera rhizosphaerae]
MTTSASPLEASESAPALRSILLMHIPKTAGTSLFSLVENEYKAGEFCATYPDWEGVKATIAGFPVNHPMQRAVIGHFMYGVHEQPELARFLAPRVEHGVFLRDPVRRVVSHYNYMIGSTHPIHQRLIDQHPTLEGFLDHIWARNAQSYFLVGAGLASVLTERLALDRLQRNFDAVGLVERFDESVVLFAWRFGWRLPYYVPPRNTTEPAPGRIHAEDLDARLVARIRAANSCDQAVYDLALEQFDAQCVEVPNFSERLARYRNAPILRRSVAAA